MIEELTGRPYAEVVQERVFDRAGMSASGFFRLDEVVPDVAVGYLPRSSPDEPWRTNIYRTRSSVAATAARTAPPATSTGSCTCTPTAACSASTGTWS